MRKKELRQRDILKLIEGLDISPTMYKNATEKYIKNTSGEHSGCTWAEN